jgi:hypothetical protein
VRGDCHDIFQVMLLGYHHQDYFANFRYEIFGGIVLFFSLHSKYHIFCFVIIYSKFVNSKPDSHLIDFSVYFSSKFMNVITRLKRERIISKHKG